MRPCTVAIIQVRLGSSRLPLKPLLAMRGLPLIDWVMTRVNRCKAVDKIVVALPDSELDDILLTHLEDNGAECFRGPESDVLARLAGAARWAEASEIVRICAHSPFVWWEAVDRLVDFFKTNLPDYAYNHLPVNNLWPAGLGAEIISRDMLEEIATLAGAPEQREDCFSYIWANQQKYSVATFDPTDPALRHPELLLNIDTVADFEKLARLPAWPSSSGKEIVMALAS